jgi:DNA-binding transcriptional LysR family regulator
VADAELHACLFDRGNRAFRIFGRGAKRLFTEYVTAGFSGSLAIATRCSSRQSTRCSASGRASRPTIFKANIGWSPRSDNGVAVAQRLELDAMMGTLQFVAASDWVAILPFVMMVSDLDDGRFDVRPLEDPPFYSEFVLIEPARKVMSPAAALFADILKMEAEQSRLVFQERTGAQRATRRRIVRSAD